MGTSLFLRKFDNIVRDLGSKTLPCWHSDGTFSHSKFCESGDGTKWLYVHTAPQDFEGKETCESHKVRTAPLLTATWSSCITFSRNHSHEKQNPTDYPEWPCSIRGWIKQEERGNAVTIFRDSSFSMRTKGWLRVKAINRLHFEGQEHIAGNCKWIWNGARLSLPYRTPQGSHGAC